MLSGLCSLHFLPSFSIRLCLRFSNNFVAFCAPNLMIFRRKFTNVLECLCSVFSGISQIFTEKGGTQKNPAFVHDLEWCTRSKPAVPGRICKARCVAITNVNVKTSQPNTAEVTDFRLPPHDRPTHLKISNSRIIISYHLISFGTPFRQKK